MHYRWHSPAKLNWYLRVLEPRQDGYHDIETLFQELELGDEIQFAPLEEGRCEIAGMPSSIPKEINLIFRAWKLLCEEYPGKVGGVDVQVEKLIPSGGGLGGGSSNAATTLLALNELYQLGAAPERLEELGARLGSDVPFFIRGGVARGEGRGERLTSLETQLPAYWVVLVFPQAFVSTPEAYARLDRLKREAARVGVGELVKRLESGDVGAVAEAIHNDFELAVSGEPWWQKTTQVLKQAGTLRSFLCGSGSTVAGLCLDKEHACEMVRLLQGSVLARVTTTRSNRASTRFDRA